MKAALLLVLAGALACGTSRRVAVWSDERVLWFEAVRLAPQKPRPWANLAEQMARQGSAPLAAAYYRQALALTGAAGRSYDEQVYGRRIIAANLARVTRDYDTWFREP